MGPVKATCRQVKQPTKYYEIITHLDVDEIIWYNISQVDHVLVDNQTLTHRSIDATTFWNNVLF